MEPQQRNYEAQPLNLVSRFLRVSKTVAGLHAFETRLHVVGAGLHIHKARLRGTAQAGQDSIHLEIRKLIAEKARPVFREPAVSYLDS